LGRPNLWLCEWYDQETRPEEHPESTPISRPCPACDAVGGRPFAEKNSHRLVQCDRCSTLYTADRVERAYDSGYAEEREAAPFLAKRLDDIVASFESSRQTGRLLDVGFGAGDFLDAARRAGWNVTGVEVAVAAVDRARHRGIDAFHGTLVEANYEAESLDVVIASELLEHIVGVVPVLREIERILRPAGLLWATTPHARGLSARLLGASWSVIAPPGHVQLFSIRGMRELLRRTGFTAISIGAEGVNPQEILQHLRGKRVSAGQRIDAAYSLNAFFEEHRARRFAKRLLNRALSASRLGDSLKIAARKQS
jgi:2-polyprenyl-3-methyl-5-hydroxy-6-metoxy-1,4-benzoquinol methylase